MHILIVFVKFMWMFSDCGATCELFTSKSLCLALDSPVAVSPAPWLVIGPVTSRWTVRSFTLPHTTFICNFGVPAGRASLPQGWGGVGRGGRGGCYVNVDDAGTPRPWTDSGRAAVGNSQRVLAVPLTRLPTWPSPVGACERWFMWWQGRPRRFFFSFFSRISQTFQAYAHRDC